jgi:hypothetical protein
LENSELVTQSRNLGLHRRAGLKRRADQGNKCDENRTHLESDDNLSNRRNHISYQSGRSFRYAQDHVFITIG